jgi:hypothetical protein
MHKDWLTKPNGHPDSPLMLVTSYPNYNTRSLEYCLTQDPSSKSMGILFTKLGRRRDAFHFDAFPRRIDMKPLRSEYPAVASRSNSKTPPMSSDWTRNYCSGGGVEFRELSGNLLRYWTAFALEMWRRSTAHVAVLMGESCVIVYLDWIRSGKIVATPFRLPFYTL